MLSLPPLHPSLVLSAYAADLVAGARIALFGDATLSLTSELVERGARLVHVFDIDAVRAAEAGTRSSRRSVVFGTLPKSGDLALEGAPFDLIFVPDLSFTKDPSLLLRTARRMLAPSGAALVASPNPDLLGGEGLGYYELYDAVASAFRRVRMVGQAPFVGYVLAELAAEEEPSVSIDTSLAGRPEPSWFIALAGERDVRFEPYALVELPYERGALREEAGFERFATIPAPPPVLPPQPDRAALDAARAEAEAKAASAVAERDRARAKEAELEKALTQERERARELETSLLSKAAELASKAAEYERLYRERTSLSKSLTEERRTREGMERELVTLRDNPELAELRERVAELSRAQAELQTNALQYQDEIEALEARLRERGRAFEERRREVSRREQLVRELVSLVEDQQEGEAVFVEEAVPPTAAPHAIEMESAEPALLPESAAVPTMVAESEPGLALEGVREDALASLQSRLDRLANEAARREADLTTAAWKIAELERLLAKQSANRDAR